VSHHIRNNIVIFNITVNDVEILEAILLLEIELISLHWQFGEPLIKYVSRCLHIH